MAEGFFRIKSGLFLAPQSSAPSSPNDGAIYYNSSTNKFQFRQDGAWEELGGGAGDIVNGGQAGNIVIGTNDATDLEFEVNNVVKMRFDESADILRIFHPDVEQSTSSSGQIVNYLLENTASAAQSEARLQIQTRHDDATPGVLWRRFNAATHDQNWFAGIEEGGTAWFLGQVTGGITNSLNASTTAIHVDDSNNVTLPNGDLTVRQDGANRTDLLISSGGTQAAASIGALQIRGYRNDVNGNSVQIEAFYGNDSSNRQIGEIRYRNSTTNPTTTGGRLGIATSNTSGTLIDAIVVDESQAVTIGESGSTQTHTFNGQQLDITNTNTNDFAGININPNGTGAAYVWLNHDSAQDWITGVNSTGSYTISRGATVAATPEFTINNSGAVFLGEADSTQGHTARGFLVLDYSTTGEGYINVAESDQFLSLSGSTGSGTGKNLRLHGQSHSTLANVFQIRTNTTVDFEIDGNSATTISRVGSSETHTWYGAQWNFENNGEVLELFHNGSNFAGFNSPQADVALNSAGDFIINIDDNSSSTDAFFRIAKDAQNGGGTELLHLSESGRMQLNDSVPGNATFGINQVGTTINDGLYLYNGSGSSFRFYIDGSDDAYITRGATEYWQMNASGQVTFREKVFFGDSSFANNVEQEYIHSTTLTNNTTAIASGFTFDSRDIKGLVIDYTIKDGNNTETGTLHVTVNNAASVAATEGSVSSTGTQTSTEVGVSWTVNISGNNAQLEYTTTNSGNNRTMRALVKKFLA